ncbi:hypothetical protein GCM10010390_45080 [Streptomyces mordarskii]|uniref:Secreted protein n=1 Tax=Streptomyces mordarskii TaxID=1226758 RepID=A0ABN1D9V2_9ACTN
MTWTLSLLCVARVAGAVCRGLLSRIEIHSFVFIDSQVTRDALRYESHYSLTPPPATEAHRSPLPGRANGTDTVASLDTTSGGAREHRVPRTRTPAPEVPRDPVSATAAVH